MLGAWGAMTLLCYPMFVTQASMPVPTSLWAYTSHLATESCCARLCTEANDHEMVSLPFFLGAAHATLSGACTSFGLFAD